MEECAKVELLGIRATSLLMGADIDPTKLSAALARHKAKNYINAYMLMPTKEETEACNAPQLSSGEERRTGAAVIVLFKRLRCVVAQSRV